MKLRKGYLCGPTVYQSQHIGNYKTFYKSIVDFKKRKQKFEILMMNITDISEKIYQSSTLDKLQVLKYTNKYIQEFVKVLKYLSLRPWTLDLQRSSFHIKAIKKDIRSICTQFKELIEVKEDGIKFYPNGNLQNGFYIWRVGPNISFFESKSLDPTLDRGIPGWHNECFTLIKKFVDHTFVHYGGTDLKPIHHFNQKALLNLFKPYKITYVHSSSLLFTNQKISKSTGNIPIAITEILTSKKLVPNYIKYFSTVSFKNVVNVSSTDISNLRAISKVLNLRKRAKIVGLVKRRQKCKRLCKYKNADYLRSCIEKIGFKVKDMKPKTLVYYDR